MPPSQSTSVRPREASKAKASYRSCDDDSDANIGNEDDVWPKRKIIKAQLTRDTHGSRVVLPMPSLGAPSFLPSVLSNGESWPCPFTGCVKKYDSHAGLLYHLQHTHLPEELAPKASANLTLLLI